MSVSFAKDPDAVLDYKFDWSDWMAEGDSITAHVIDAETGITVDSSLHGDDYVTVWLSGGDDDGRYDVSCEITTARGRTDERTILIKVGER